MKRKRNPNASPNSKTMNFLDRDREARIDDIAACVQMELKRQGLLNKHGDCADKSPAGWQKMLEEAD